MHKHKRYAISILVVIIFLASSLTSISLGESQINKITTNFVGRPTAIAVSDSNPFYALIATPLAVSYNDLGKPTIIPLYVKNFDNPSKSVERLEKQIGRYADYVIGKDTSPKKTYLNVAISFWQSCDDALIIKNDFEGYKLGIVATPLASYLNIPVIVTSEIDNEVTNVLDNLGVTHVYICGDLNTNHYEKTIFESNKDIINKCSTDLLPSWTVGTA